MFGEIEITPIESNIAVKFWVSASPSSSSSSVAFAHDDDLSTAWIAEKRAADHWLMLDLGGAYDNLRKSEVVFADRNAVYQYQIEASSNGSDWETIADRRNNTVMAEGFVDLFTRPGIRYLRLTITGVTMGATVGVKEWRVFNYLRQDIVNGADMSYMDQLRNRLYYLNPNPSLVNMGPGPHVLDVVKDRGMKFIRLRIWNEPRAENSGNPHSIPYCSPERSAVVATWVKERGLQLGIDFHYADSWADPGKQPKPRAWAELPFESLTAAVHDFTYAYIRQLVEQGTAPERAAIGNEIINGFLWGSEMLEMGLGTINPPYVRAQPQIYLSQPGGGLLWRYWDSDDPLEQQKYNEAWERFSTLVAAGVRAVREASPQTLVEIHIVNDKDRLEKTMEFWRQLLSRLSARGAQPDVLALSYYPEWHGSFADLEEALHAMATTYPQYKIVIAETAYPATGEDLPLPNADQPRTIQGQANMLKRTIQAVNDIVDNKGIGVLVWEPQEYQPMFRQVPGMPNYFEPYASLDVYHKVFAQRLLETPLYRTTFVKTAPDLPAKIPMLTLSDGSVELIPVAWEAIDPARYASPGSFSVSGVTAYGNVTAWVNVMYPYGGFFKPTQLWLR